MKALNEQSSRRAAELVCDSTVAGDVAPRTALNGHSQRLPGQHMLSSSFGAQSAVMLHLVTRQAPDIPVVVVDTGYLFPETYRFIDETDGAAGPESQGLFRSAVSSAWQEARHGRRWEQGVEGLREYNRDNKVEPMERALDELDVGTWFAGLRRSQSNGRTADAVHRYLGRALESTSDRGLVGPGRLRIPAIANELPYHPLWDKGYVSIGDVHTTKSLLDVSSVEETRFFGLQRECGLHEMDFGKTPELRRRRQERRHSSQRPRCNRRAPAAGAPRTACRYRSCVRAWRVFSSWSVVMCGANNCTKSSM